MIQIKKIRMPGVLICDVGVLWIFSPGEFAKVFGQLH